MCANRHASSFDIKGWTSFAYSRGISFKSFLLCFFASFLPFAIFFRFRLFFLFLCLLYLCSFTDSLSPKFRYFVLFTKISNDSEFEHYRLSRVFQQTVQLTALRHLFNSLVGLESWRGIVSKRCDVHFFFSRDIIVIFLWKNSSKLKDRSIERSFPLFSKRTNLNDMTDFELWNFRSNCEPLWNFTASTNTVSREIPSTDS